MNRIAVLASAFCGGAFGATLVLFKIDPDDFVALDSLATKVVAPFQFFTPSEFFIALTTLGGLPAVALVGVLVAVFLRSEKKLLARLILALGTSWLLVILVKNTIDRIRPNGLPWLSELHSYSFPSGHTTSATVLYGFIGIILYYKVRNRSLRFLLLSLLSALIVGIGMSRIVLAVHYGSDVLAGFFLGGFCLSLLFIYPLSFTEKAYLKR